MSFLLCRGAVQMSLCARSSRRAGSFLLSMGLLMGLFTAAAHAVVVRGHLTDAYGKPLSGGQVRLSHGGQIVAIASAGPDGAYELRAADAGRFTLLGSATGYLPGIGSDFYAGVTDVLEQEVVLARDTVKQDITVSATGLPTPLPQLTAPVSLIPGASLELQADVVDTLRQAPGNFVVQTGGMGGVTSLFIRGGNSTANLVTMDGMPAGDVGGTFDFGTVSSTALSSITVVRPLLTYSGDAGNLHTYRNEVTGSGVYNRADYFGAFSRVQTANDVQFDEFHNVTSAANVGYAFNGNTQLRITVQNKDSATGVPGPYDFQGTSSNNGEKDQDLYATGTLENRYKDNWHNLVRYGIARKREQENEYAAGGIALAVDPGEFGGPGNVGNIMTIQGANGYKVKGQVQLFSGNNYDQDSNRDQVYYQSDYTANRHFTGLFGFRYDKERGSYNDYFPAYSYSEHEQIQRTNFEYNLQFQGEFFDRLFYSAGGAIEKNHLYGIAGTPRVGLSYVPVRPNGRALHGTRLRANYATGVQEPTLALYFSSLYTQLENSKGGAAYIAQYQIGPPAAERSKTYDLGLDQNIVGEKLTMKFGYFHNVFDRQLEGVPGKILVADFGLNVPALNSTYFTGYVNSLAYRAQGAEFELTWHPMPRFVLRGGYTYLDTRVVQSFASDADAANAGTPTTNPNLPGIAIGAYSPLVGARPFRRAPHTGYFDAQYTRRKLTVDLQAAMAGRSDDSTFLVGEDLNGGNTLLLPNRDLDYGYVKLDLGFTYALKHSFTYFAQAENLLNDQRIGPIGYPGLPLTFRTGLKLRLGGD
jgi:vitamin B12 transporter